MQILSMRQASVDDTSLMIVRSKTDEI